MIFLILKIKKNVKKFFFFFKYANCILYIIAYELYYLSLEGCFDGEEICGNNMDWIYQKLIELILSCELISFLVGQIIFNRSSNNGDFFLILLL